MFTKFKNFDYPNSELLNLFLFILSGRRVWSIEEQLNFRERIFSASSKNVADPRGEMICFRFKTFAHCVINQLLDC